MFARSKQYYNNRQYRFEVPQDDFEPLQAFLADNGCVLTPVDETETFVVAVEKYTSHLENIFKECVIQRSVDGYNCFLLRNQVAVEQAAHNGAARLSETEVAPPSDPGVPDPGALRSDERISVRLKPGKTAGLVATGRDDRRPRTLLPHLTGAKRHFGNQGC